MQAAMDRLDSFTRRHGRLGRVPHLGLSTLPVLAEDPAAHALIHELFSVSRRNDEVREELAQLYRRMRGRVAEVLRAKERAGVVKLRGDADAVASLLFALGDGLELQLVSDPDWDSSETFATGAATARFLLGA